jgi:hypothetical protein
MKKFINKANTTITIAILATMAFANSVSAQCDICVPTGANVDNVEVFVWGNGSFGAGGSGINDASGPADQIVRSQLNESDGFVNIDNRAAVDDEGCGTCEQNSIAASVKAGAYNRGYSGVQGIGPTASSSVGGNAEVSAKAGAQRLRYSQ